MLASKFLFPSLREDSTEGNVSSDLLIKCGAIYKVASGIYAYTPFGNKLVQKASAVIRKHMEKINSVELSMPMVQPKSLWRQSGRWETFGENLLRLKDRRGRELCLSPTHEELITELVKNKLQSYKEFPRNFFQIQTKFRDEERPRGGLLRCKEFLMKDAYSFDLDKQGLDQIFAEYEQAYTDILEQFELKFLKVQADSGAIGGAESIEFQVLTSSGEDKLLVSDDGYAANIECATSIVPTPSTKTKLQELATLDTPNVKSIEQLANEYNIQPCSSVKTMIVHHNNQLTALIIRGDQKLNEYKLNHLFSDTDWSFASDDMVKQKIGASFGSLGPVELSDKGVRVIVDPLAQQLVNFSCGANSDGKHLLNVNWHRDAKYDQIYDLTYANVGDVPPNYKMPMREQRGIEIGHIFKLGTKYSEAMELQVNNKDGKKVFIEMGCYGFGVSRLIAAVIEQLLEQNDFLVYPDALQPFQVVIATLSKDEQLTCEANKIYSHLQKQGVDVLFYDLGGSIGKVLNDLELLGLRHLILLGKKSFNEGKVEVKDRKLGDTKLVDLSEIESITEHIKLR